MAIIPKQNPLEHSLNDIEEVNQHREHAGLSMIGSKCHRYLQLSHYWAFETKISKRVRRLFNFGHMMEDQMIADLESQGYKFSGAQDQIVGFGGHWKGHIDGRFQKDDIDYLAEFKTHNDKSFKDLVAKGVKESKPTHYGQIQAYMGYKDIKECIYVGYNKNDSAYYIEFVQLDEEYFAELKSKEAEVLLADTLLSRIGANKYTWFECKFCSARQECFGKKEVSRNCRTCANVDVLDAGKWQCNLKSKILTVDEQRAGCDKYETAIMFKEL